MKAKNTLGHYNKKKEASENQVHRLRFLPFFICILFAVIIWLLVVNLTNSDYKKSSFFHPDSTDTEQTEEIEQSDEAEQPEENAG